MKNQLDVPDNSIFLSYPLLPFTIALLSGLIISDTCSFTLFYKYLLLFTSQVLYFVNMRLKRVHFSLIPLILCGITMGIFLNQTEQFYPEDGQEEKSLVITGTVVKHQYLTDDQSYSLFRMSESTHRELAFGNRYIDLWFNNGTGNSIIPGDHLEIMCAVQLRTTEPNLLHMVRSKADFYAQINKSNSILTQYSENIYILSKICFFLHEFFKSKIVCNLPQPSNFFYNALLLGDRISLSKEVQEDFKNTGLFHLLAISGQHMALVVWSITLVTKHWVYKQKFRSVVVLLLITGYTAMIVSRASIMRSYCMVVLFLLAPFYNRRSTLLNILACAALLQIVYDPLVIRDIGFQFTYAAVLGIALFTESILAQMKKLPLGFLRTPCAVSLAAQSLTIPLTAYYFQQISLFAFLSFLIVLPLFTIMLVLGIASLPLLSISAYLPMTWLSDILHRVAELLIALVDFLAETRFFSITYGPPALLSLVLYYLLMSCFLFRYRFRFLSTCAIIIILLIACIEITEELQQYVPTDQLRVEIINVFQGDSAIIRFPSGQVMVLDGGGSPYKETDQLQEITLRILREKRIHFIDYLVVSHPDADHVKGIIRILESLDVGEVWFPRISSGYTEKLILLCLEKGVKRKILGGYIPSCLKLDTNNRSLVLQIVYRKFRILFPGDIQSELESRYVNQYNEIASTVLKIPHHGSAGSCSIAFLSAVNPELCILSVGKKNPFGHPSSSVLERFDETLSSYVLLRTDLYNNIFLETDGDTVRYYSGVH